jgi:hypothetical protein
VLGRNQPVATARGPVACHARLAGSQLGHGLEARSPAAWWRLAGDKVLVSSTMAEQWMRRARGADAGPTDVVTRRWGGATARDGVLVGGRVGCVSD